MSERSDRADRSDRMNEYTTIVAYSAAALVDKTRSTIQSAASASNLV